MSHTQNKYMMVLQYICAQPSFHSKNTMRQFKVSNNFLTAGKELGLFKTIGISQYKWNLSRPPLMSDVQDIQMRVRSYTQTHRLKTKPTPQLSIKPIRKAPVPTPTPVVQEAECDTSNSKMFLILAVGAIVGFIIATIIWK
jgi:hypothetical protein